MAIIIINNVNSDPQNKTRGIGVYSRELFKALKTLKSDHQFILATQPSQLDQADLIHFPYFQLFFTSLPAKKTAKWVITIHDLIPLSLPKYFQPGIKGQLALKKQLTRVKQAEAIITDSNYSQTDITKHLGLVISKIKVIPLAPGKEFKPLSQKVVRQI